jgi:hypothetical protein
VSGFSIHPWPEYVRGGLVFRLVALDPAPYYFGGDTPKFKLVVENKGSAGEVIPATLAWATRTEHENYNGSTALRPRTGESVEVPGGGTREFPFSVFCLIPGGLAIQLTFVTPHQPDLPQTVPLAYYTVFDRGAKEESDKHLSRLERLQVLTILAFVASVATQAVVLYVTLGR